MSKQRKHTQKPVTSSTKKPLPKQHRNQPKKANNWIYAAIAVVALAIVAAFYFMRPGQTPDSTATTSQEISVAQAYEKYQSGAFVLDVRTQEEWDEYHAPNTTLIPLDQLASRVNELPRNREIVVVCRSGNRSQEGRDILLRAGFTQVSSMAGGLIDWRAAGYATVAGP
jgi:rhodanese-related sulfurtransferase